MSQTKPYRVSHLDALEAESIFVMREVMAEFERPVLLFSGGKDSIVMLRLAEKAFAPARIPFPVMHVDTGHNFPEVLAYRDRRVAELGLQPGRSPACRRPSTPALVRELPDGTRNRIQTPVLLAAVEKYRFDALFGGARRDEEKARAKERMFSFRDEFGQWDPKNQRPELWSLYNGRHHPGESIRVFPLSNWTELDVWHYIAQERIALPSIYFAHEREVVERDGMLYAVNEFIVPQAGRDGRSPRRCATAPSATRRCTAAVLLATPTRSRRSSTRSPRPGSPSAARPAATTRSARRRWKTASGKATSDESGSVWSPTRPPRAAWTCCGSPPPAASTTASRP